MQLLSTNLVTTLITEPEKGIDAIDLVYVNDDDLCITREKISEKFIYKDRGVLIKNPKILSRIEDLVIPPNWNKVRIYPKANGHLLAVGRDAKNRKQYLYHPTWQSIRNKTKFYKMIDFGEVLPKIRQKIEIDLQQRKWTRTKVLALIIKLLEETHVRIGNTQYEKRNQTYGLTTLRSRHLTKDENKLRLEFVGKRGKEHRITIRNKKLVRLINQCEEIPGWKLFKYYDKDGVKRAVDSSQVNEYIHGITNQNFSAKDFRTWAASAICFEFLYEFGLEKDANQNKKNSIKAIDNTAKELGNTRNVCRQYYIHPKILSAYENSEIKKYFNLVDEHLEKPKYFSPTEQAMLQLFKDYEIVLD